VSSISTSMTRLVKDMRPPLSNLKQAVPMRERIQEGENAHVLFNLSVLLLSFVPLQDELRKASEMHKKRGGKKLLDQKAKKILLNSFPHAQMFNGNTAAK